MLTFELEILLGDGSAHALAHAARQQHYGDTSIGYIGGCRGSSW